MKIPHFTLFFIAWLQSYYSLIKFQNIYICQCTPHFYSGALTVFLGLVAFCYYNPSFLNMYFWIILKQLLADNKWHRKPQAGPKKSLKKHLSGIDRVMPPKSKENSDVRYSLLFSVK